MFQKEFLIMCKIHGVFPEKIFDINNKICFISKNKINKEKFDETTNKFKKSILTLVLINYHGRVTQYKFE